MTGTTRTTSRNPKGAGAAGSGSDSLEIRLGTAQEEPTRDAYVLAHPQANFFHQSGWRRVVESQYSHERRDLFAWKRGELVGVLPLMLCAGLRRRRNLISVPYSVYGGPLGNAPSIERKLVEHAIGMAEAERVGRLELRFVNDPGNELPGTDLYWTFVRDLPESPDEVLARMPKKARAEARKAREKHGLEMSEGAWYVDDLYRLFLANKHSLGSPSLPASHFRAILNEFGSKVHVHVVRQGRTPVSAVMSFGFRDTLIAYYAGTRPGADRTCSASNFMYMALQEWAVERGYEVFDFCRSRGDSGAFRFKVHQGFEPAPLHYRFHLVKDRSTPSFTPSNPKTRLLRRAWSKLPMWSARWLSKRLARYLP